MAVDEDGNLIDLFNGMEDLRNGVLRTPLPAEQTMMDDPLRFLRAIRFSVTKGFEPHRDIFIAMQNPEIKEKLMQTVSAERIREEVFKMMKHDTVKSLRLLHHIEEDFIPGFISMIFGRGLWLKPTFEI
jgi:tRNA nucleotidyltransferase/poly(A) polymerase